MSGIFSFLSQNPAYAVGAVILLLVGAFSLFKKLLKLAIVVGILLLGYGFYLHSEGKALPTTADAERMIQQGKDMTAKLEKQAQRAAKEASQASAKVDAARAKIGSK